MSAKGIYDNQLTDYIYETAAGAITATAGGGASGATLITAQTTRVSIVATRGDSVKLPPAVPGLELVLINDGVATMAVYPSGSDAINGLSGGAFVLQMQQSTDVYACGIAGKWHAEVGGGYAGSFFTELAEDNITATAGGGQSGARLLTSQTSRIAIVTTMNDSIRLPPSAAGLELMVMNSGANAMQVFGSGADVIDGQPTANGVSQMANSLVIFACASTGAWFSEGLATGFGGPGLQTQSYGNNLTSTGTTQATGLTLTSMINRLTTVPAFSGVVLPVSAPGLMITVTNRGVNPLVVYGAGSDLVNSIAFVVMPISSTAVFVTAAAGQWECEGIGAGFAGQLPTVSTTNGITATAGGGQATAVVLSTVINRITVVATAADSVRLPAAVAGLQITIYNAAAANAANVFPSTTDAINAQAASAAFSLAAGKNATFGSAVTGQWHAIVSA